MTEDCSIFDTNPPHLSQFWRRQNVHCSRLVDILEFDYSGCLGGSFRCEFLESRHNPSPSLSQHLGP